MRSVRVGAIGGLLIGALHASALAQTTNLTIGPILGLGFATWGGADAGGVGKRTGFLGGGFLSVPLGPLLWFRPEVYVAQKGFKESQQDASVEFKTDYIEVPALLGLTIPVQGSSIRPYVYAGPAISFNMNCKVTGSQGGTSTDIPCDDPLFSQVLGEELKMKGVDVGVLFGAGLGFPVGPGQLAVGVRYNLGFTKTVDVTGDPDVKNRVLSVTADFGFPLGR